MNRMFWDRARALTYGLVCVVATALATTQVVVAETIAVQSLLGQQLTAVELGSTVFDKKVYRVNIRSWSLDAASEKALSQALNKPASQRRASPRRVTSRIGNREYWRRIHEAPDSFWDARDYDPTRVQSGLRRLNRRGISRLVLVLNAKCEDSIHESNYTFASYGMYHNTGFLSKGTHLYACYRLVVLDTANGRVAHQEKVLDSVKVNSSRWPKDWKRLSRRDSDWLRDYMSAMMESGLPKRLASAGLISESKAQQFAGARQSDEEIPDFTSDEYAATVREVYRATGIQLFFERNARRYLFAQLRVPSAQRVLFNDVAREWTKRHFNWRSLDRRLVFMYRRLNITRDELEDIAQLANRRGARWKPTSEEATGLMRIWEELADANALEELVIAGEERQSVIYRARR